MITLSAQEDIQKAVLGRSYDIKPENLDSEISKLLETLDEAEYEYSIPGNLEALVKIMVEEWAEGE